MRRNAPRRSWLGRTLTALRAQWSGPFKLDESGSWAKFNAALFGDESPSYAGVSVTDQNAFTFSAVYDAVNQLSSDVAKLPLNLHKRLKGGGSEHYHGSKVYRLLKYQPNPEMGSMVFRRTLMAHALTMKGAFAEIVRDGNGQPAALWPLLPHLVTMDRDRGRLIYRVKREDDGREDVLSAGDVLHIHGLGYNGYCAYPVIDVARQAIGLAIAAERFGGSFFRNGARFGGALEIPPGMFQNEEDRKKFLKQLDGAHQGPERAYKLLALYEGIKYVNTAGVKPSEAEMKDLRDQQVEEVARFFNMPAYKLKLTKPGAVSYASIEQNALEYYKGPILNWVTLWEEELNRKLISPLEQSQQFVKHNANAFLRGDSKSRAEALAVMRQNGIINANQWLDMEDMNPQAGEQGTLYLVQEQQIPVNRINDLIDSKIAKNEAPIPTPAGPSQTDLDAANARALAAEALATEAREAAEAARADLAQLRGEKSATDAMLQETIDRAHAETGRAAALEAVAIEVRQDAERLRQQVAEAQAAIAAAQSLTARAETSLADAVREREQTQSLATEAGTVATAAEQRVTAAQAALDALRVAMQDGLAVSEEARIAAETAATEATAAAAQATAERDRLRAEAIGAAERETAATWALDQVRADLDAITARVADIEAERDAATVRAEQAATEAQTAADRAQALADAAADAERTAKTDADTLRATLAILEAERDAALTSSETTVAELERMSAEAIAWTERTTAAEERLAALQAEKAEAEARAREAEQRAIEAESIRAASSALIAADMDRLRAESANAEQRAAEAIAAAERATADMAALAAERVAAEQSAEAACAQLAASQTAEADRRALVLAAQRGLIVDALGRMTRRECQQARAKQATPEKLRRWLSGFAEAHQDICVDAVLPAMRAHLAWTGTTDDPLVVTTALVNEHIATFETSLRAVLDGDPDDFHTRLERTLTRWETDRAATVADRLLTEEIRRGR